MELFDSRRTYQPIDEEMRLLGSIDRLAQWRHHGQGPAFYRIGRKVLYRGADINAWLEARRVEPTAA